MAWNLSPGQKNKWTSSGRVNISNHPDVSAPEYRLRSNGLGKSTFWNAKGKRRLFRPAGQPIHVVDIAFQSAGRAVHMNLAPSKPTGLPSRAVDL